MATTAYEVPVTPGVPQAFSISLAGTFYNLSLRWSTSMSAWFLDIADAGDVPILTGVPLVTGADLLGQYGYLEFGGQLIVQSDNAPGLVPDFDNLGTTGHLYFVVTPAAAVAAVTSTSSPPGPPLPSAPTYRLVNTLLGVSVLASDQVIGVDTNALAVSTNFALPNSASRLGVPLTFKDVGLKASTYNITLTCNGTDKVDPNGVSPPGQAATVVIRNNGQDVQLLPVAGGWQRLG